MSVRCPDRARATVLREALTVEAGDPLGGADVEITGTDDPSVFVIAVHAVDLVHLRAAVNSFLKWLQVADASVQATQTGPEDAV